MNWTRGILYVAIAGAFACGCSGGKETDAGPAPSGSTPTDAAVNYAPPGTEAPKGNLEVVAFKGGYGIDFYQKAAIEFQAKNPDVKISVTGDPRVWEQLKPRLIGGDAPDLMYPGWGMDHWALAEEDGLQVLDKALDSPAVGSTGTWRESFEPTILKLGQKDGHQYVLPYFFSVWGWWYDPNVFAKNGWTPPKTFDELLTLCDKIKAKGMAPITFQGKYPYYMMQGMLLPWAQSIGGIQVINDAQNLVPGAWKSPAMLQSAKMIKQLGDKGYFEDGAVALTHTDSQTDFLNGKAAMIPCGTWLDSEMRKTMPPGAKIQFLLPPAVTGGKGDPGALVIEIEPWMVPKDAKNANAAVAFFKYMTSLPKAKEFVEQKATLMSIKGSDQAKLPPTLVEPARLFRQSKTVYSFTARTWYTAMETEIENSLTSMLNGTITPEQFCDRAEAAAQKTRDDKSITKHKVE